MRYTPYDVPTGVLSPPPDYGTILPTTNAAANVSAPPPPYYSYAPPAMSGSGSGGPQQPTGSSYNFSYAAGTPPVGSSEYTYNAAVQDGRDSCYNMVYFPPNPTTGFNGHFSLVTPPQQHQETPIDGAVVNPAVTSSGQTMQDAWHPSSWASQAQATSNCNLMENNQHYSISTGFASQSDAEMALSTTGVKAESKPIVLEPKPMPYLQHLHSNSSAHNVNSLNAENNNLEHSVISEEDTKDPLSASIQAQDQATEVSVATNLINQEQSQQNHVNFFPERNY